MRHHKLLSAAIAALALVGLTAPQAVNPPIALAAAYTYSCPANIQYDYEQFVGRGSGLGGVGADYHAAIGDAYVRMVNPCSYPPDFPVLSAILPANIEYSAGAVDVVQLGWAICNSPAGMTCGNDTYPVPNDGMPHFVYTCSDQSQGEACAADSWAGPPLSGRRYRFRVEHTTSSTWKFTITDITAGTSVTKSITAHWSVGDAVWWGGEAYDATSMLGPKNTDSPQLNLYWMQYLRNATGTSWQVAEPVSIQRCVIDMYTGGCVVHSWPTQFGYTVYSQNYTNDAVNLFTKPH